MQREDGSSIPTGKKSRESASQDEIQPSAGKKRVLLIDDNKPVCDSLTEILQKEGFEAIASNLGFEAVKWAELFRPDVIICDIGLPDMRGIEQLRKLHRSFPECRIVLFSGHPSVGEVLSDTRGQFQRFEFLPKPVRPELLLSMLRSHRAVSDSDSSI